MSFQHHLRHLPPSKQKSILHVFRQWTAWDERRSAILIYQLLWEHFLEKVDILAILDWLAQQDPADSFAQSYSLKQFLRDRQQLKGGLLRCDQPVRVGTVISWERFQGYLYDCYGDEFDGPRGINEFINGLEKNFRQLPLHQAKISFRKERPIGWFFWDSTEYPAETLLGQARHQRQKDFFVEHLGLNREEFALNKLLLFVFNLDDMLQDEFKLHRPTIGDAACNLNFLPPQKNEDRFGMTVPSTIPQYAWFKSAGPVWGMFPERSRPEAVGQNELLRLEHIVDFQILD